MVECVCICTGLPYILSHHVYAYLLDASYTIPNIFSYVVEKIPKYSCGIVISLELTCNGVAIYICMHGAREEKNPAIHARTDVFLGYL